MLENVSGIIGGHVFLPITAILVVVVMPQFTVRGGECGEFVSRQSWELEKYYHIALLYYHTAIYIYIYNIVVDILPTLWLADS